ncbi:sigma-70 family RNA polymerase sigma factor [Clostridiaceae bacterium M8S5]|nr:sigma-70 family RNA polymerase sigma factor [Clostridiaceae bacterium M8S5]
MLKKEYNIYDLYITIFNTYQSKIYHIAYSVLGNDYDAKDIVQDTVMKAVDKIGQLKNDEKLEFWICSIAYNFSKLRYNQNKKNVKVEQYCFDKLNYDKGLTSIPENLIEEERRSFMLRKIECLNPKYSKVIYLYFYKNLSYKEISDELNISIGTVKSRIYRGKLCLKNMLNLDTHFNCDEWSKVPDYGLKKLS